MVDHSEGVRELVVGSLRNCVGCFEAGSVGPDDARALLDWFAQVHRLAAAGMTLAAGAAVADEPWLRAGDRSAEAWLATRIDATIGEARALLGTAERLPAAPATEMVFRAGELSVAKAEAVTAAVAVAPDAETELLDAASHGSLRRVQQDAARVRAAADPDPAATHARIHKRRGWRRWTDADGSRCGTYRLTPEDGAMLEAAAQPFVDGAVDRARRDGNDDPYEALAADGLVAMARHILEGDTDAALPKARGARGRKRLGNRRELIGVVDLSAWLDAIDDSAETVDIVGVGPVPLSIARQIFGDALLQIVIRRGVDIQTVVHTGRTASAVQETAILVRQNGRCAVDHCDRAPAEIDHLDGFPRTGPVTIDGLDAKCGYHHDRKTHRRASDERGPP